jgi:hypothetical protein
MGDRIFFTSRGSFDHMESFLKKMLTLDIRKLVQPYAEQGVTALNAATPRDSGLAAESWYYEIEATRDHVIIRWLNRDIENGFPVAVMLQYGYATGTGGYVQGRDYINPALRPIFDNIADGVWKVVTTS